MPPKRILKRKSSNELVAPVPEKRQKTRISGHSSDSSYSSYSSDGSDSSDTIEVQASELVTGLPEKQTIVCSKKEKLPLGNLAALYDLDPKDSRSMSRWAANKAFRESGEEKLLAEEVLGDNWYERYSLMLQGRCPLGFPDENSWNLFLAEFLTLMFDNHPYLTGTVGLRGSSVTFMSMHPRKGATIFFSPVSYC
eukprot:TRINITY_DN6305_c0_g2_i1.p1 TRINITY_DN6305_c0_g2~~TRINITY_DN6305_c0_g2_i1.p1  ORF type:complete len:202 (+),score=32.38 TRINITY_DN6305_c0_g2_i1:24-608(+)